MWMEIYVIQILQLAPDCGSIYDRLIGRSRYFIRRRGSGGAVLDRYQRYEGLPFFRRDVLLAFG